jgi:hypothetical protein
MNLPSCFNTSSSACFWSVALATWKSGATDKNGTLVICQVSIEHIMMQCLGIIHVCTFTCYCPQPIAGWAYWWRPNVMGWWGRGEVNQKHRKSPNKFIFIGWVYRLVSGPPKGTSALYLARWTWKIAILVTSIGGTLFCRTLVKSASPCLWRNLSQWCYHFHCTMGIVLGKQRSQLRYVG